MALRKITLLEDVQNALLVRVQQEDGKDRGQLNAQRPITTLLLHRGDTDVSCKGCLYVAVSFSPIFLNNLY